MNKDNVIKKGKVIVGGTLREKLKAKLKDLIRKQMKEISASGAAGGSPADGSAGPVKTPYAFGKIKDPTTGLDGYKQVGKNETGTINEKEGKKSEKSEKEPTKKSEPKPYEPIVKPKTPEEKAADELSAGNEKRKKEVELVAKIVSGWADVRKKASKASPKKTD
jgi:hypothetical protein